MTLPRCSTGRRRRPEFPRLRQFPHADGLEPVDLFRAQRRTTSDSCARADRWAGGRAMRGGGLAPGLLARGLSWRWQLRHRSSPPEPTRPAPVAGGYKIGKPYKIDGRWYYPSTIPTMTASASRRGTATTSTGSPTANGEVFDMNRITAAHHDAAAAEPRAGHQSRQRPQPRLARQRSRALRRRPADRPVASRGPRARLRAQGLAKVRVQFVQIDDGQAVRPADAAAGNVAVAGAAAPAMPEPSTAIAVASRRSPRRRRPCRWRRPGAGAADAVPAHPPVRVRPARVSWRRTGAGRIARLCRRQLGRAGRCLCRCQHRPCRCREMAHLQAVRIEPAFVGGSPVARVRLGPIDTRERGSDAAGGSQRRSVMTRLLHLGSRQPAGFGVSSTAPHPRPARMTTERAHDPSPIGPGRPHPAVLVAAVPARAFETAGAFGHHASTTAPAPCCSPRTPDAADSAGVDEQADDRLPDLRALRQGRLQLDDMVPISETAWKMGGSQMFLEVGERVAVKDLLRGIIIQSGNDACVAMAEALAGSEAASSS